MMFDKGKQTLVERNQNLLLKIKFFILLLIRQKTKIYNLLSVIKYFKNLNLIIKTMGRAVFRLIKINTHTEYQPKIQGIIIFYRKQKK
ncbi:unnamed protein product [Paramecium sonneborni]|uniref:Uncharacterized protein n=1 Tax=Paramecium sonneborni TaxID=65129 RepID=A0A8S1PAC6_9CILI|nr:unnamed protein product [Paramecium sonneborni]